MKGNTDNMVLLFEQCSCSRELSKHLMENLDVVTLPVTIVWARTGSVVHMMTRKTVSLSVLVALPPCHSLTYRTFATRPKTHTLTSFTFVTVEIRVYTTVRWTLVTCNNSACSCHKICTLWTQVFFVVIFGILRISTS